MIKLNITVSLLVFGILFSGFSYAQDDSKSTFSSSTPVGFGSPAIPKLKKVDSLGDFFKEGSPDLSFRLRYENVKQYNALHPAEAVTLRTLLGFHTAEFHSVDGYLQMINVTTPNYSTYNSTDNGNTTYSVIADPKNTALNQGYLGFSAIPASYLKVGRQIINLDNQRFIGAVMFRQNMQNFDAISFTNQYFKNTTFFFAYLNNVNTIFATHISSDDYLINIKYSGLPCLDIIPYAYLLNQYGKYQNSVDSTNTFGLRLTGSTSSRKKVKYNYVAEYADQYSAESNPLNFSAYYYHLGAGFIWSLLSLNVDQEVLSGSNNSSTNLSFRTPLATKHAFQGWADMFLTTPSAGVKDLFGTLEINLPKWKEVKLTTVYHHFESEKGSAIFGDEWDAGIFKKFKKHYNLGLEYANFKTANVRSYASTTKYWVTASIDFA